MKRTLAFFVLAALLALPACSSRTGSAATLNGSKISVEQVKRDVAGFAQSEAFRSALAQQGVTISAKSDRMPTSFAAQWLVSLIQNQAIAQIAKQRGVTATAEERAAARTQFTASATSGKAYKELPKWLQAEVSGAAALQAALRSSLPQASNAGADAQAYQALVADCSSKKLVGHILVDTPELAQQVVDQLKKGTAFADVSKQVSKDTTAAAQGGLLMCVGSSQWPQIDPTFRAAAEATPVGTVSAPVKTQFGYHVIEVLELNETNATPLVLATAKPADPLTKVLSAFIAKAKITVNPQFGTLRKQGGSFTIDPPKPKQPKSRPVRTVTTTRPPAAPSSGSAPGSGSGSSGVTSTPTG